VLKIRTNRGMVTLNNQESSEFRERLRRDPAARSAEGTIAVSSNASTSITFSGVEKAAVLEVLRVWHGEQGAAGMGAGPAELRDELAKELGREP
jgi:hypothetical protein